LSTNPIEPEESVDMDLEPGASGRHAREPWEQQGRYIRDAEGRIVVRGRTAADARRIVAAINATRGIPTEALEGWFPVDVSDATTRPDLEIEIHPDPSPSPFEVRPPAAPFAPEGAESPTEVEAGFLFDRRVFERRLSDWRPTTDRRRGERRRATRANGSADT
jgi:hypothetical protein